MLFDRVGIQHGVVLFSLLERIRACSLTLPIIRAQRLDLGSNSAYVYASVALNLEADHDVN